MEIYVEYVIIDNFIIDWLLLKSSLNCCKVKTGKLRLLIASLLGTAVAVLMPLFKLQVVFNIIIKILLGALMVVVAGRYNGYMQAVKTFFTFICLTMLSGGAIISCFYLAGIDYTLYYNINYNSFLPIGISVLAVFLLTKFTVKSFQLLLKYKYTKPLIRKCEIHARGKKLTAYGFIDSGNSLVDTSSGLPIIVVSKNLFKKLEYNAMLKIPVKTLSFSTVSSESIMKIYIIDKLVIYNGIEMNIYNNVLIGYSGINFDKGVEYDILLHPSTI